MILVRVPLLEPPNHEFPPPYQCPSLFHDG